MPQRILSHIPPRQKAYVTVRTRDAFLAALVKLQRGDRIIYHTGDLRYDRDNLSEASTGRIRPLARVAYKAFKEGSVTLVQKRLGYAKFEYQAVKL